MTFAEWLTNCEAALTLHFEHLYFISVDTLPTHLTPCFNANHPGASSGFAALPIVSSWPKRMPRSIGWKPPLVVRKCGWCRASSTTTASRV
jgi:hypothetical protein